MREATRGAVVIELFNFIEDNHDRIVAKMLDTIPKTVGAYARMSKPELKQSVEHLIEGYTDLLVTGEDKALRTFFKYLSKVRASQSFGLSDVMRAQMCLPSVLRTMLQEEFRDMRGDGLSLFNASMAKVEDTSFTSICLFADIYQEYLSSRIEEHNEYLNEQNEQLGVDLSQFILFRG